MSQTNLFLFIAGAFRFDLRMIYEADFNAKEEIVF
jgi:hypothetical protein